MVLEHFFFFISQAPHPYTRIDCFFFFSHFSELLHISVLLVVAFLDLEVVRGKLLFPRAAFEPVS